MKDVYIYTLIDPRDNRIRYVGKTTNINRRLIQHVYEAKTLINRRYITNWVKSLLDVNLKPIIQEIDSCTKAEWEQKEKYWIKHYKELYPDLCNHSEGGLGTVGKGSFKHLSQEHRKALSDRAKVNLGKFEGRYSKQDKQYLWDIIKENEFVESNKIDDRITRSIYFQVKTGRTWNDVTGLDKPKLRGKTTLENHPSAKLNMKIAEEIRDLHKNQNLTQTVLAKRYNVSIMTISKIVRNLNWPA